eukprot:12929530-Prorocentrum_lima.AAC.1
MRDSGGGRGSRSVRVRRQAGALPLTSAFTLGSGGNQVSGNELTQGSGSIARVMQGLWSWNFLIGLLEVSRGFRN